MQFENKTYGIVDVDQVVNNFPKEEDYLQPVPCNPEEQDNAIYSIIKKSTNKNNSFNSSES